MAGWLKRLGKATIRALEAATADTPPASKPQPRTSLMPEPTGLPRPEYFEKLLEVRQLSFRRFVLMHPIVDATRKLGGGHVRAMMGGERLFHDLLIDLGSLEVAYAAVVLCLEKRWMGFIHGDHMVQLHGIMSERLVALFDGLLFDGMITDHIIGIPSEDADEEIMMLEAAILEAMKGFADGAKFPIGPVYAVAERRLHLTMLAQDDLLPAILDETYKHGFIRLAEEANEALTHW